jgi:hypothetical protein
MLAHVAFVGGIAWGTCIRPVSRRSGLVNNIVGFERAAIWPLARNACYMLHLMNTQLILLVTMIVMEHGKTAGTLDRTA